MTEILLTVYQVLVNLLAFGVALFVGGTVVFITFAISNHDRL